MTSRKWRLYLLPVVGWSKVCARGCVTPESEITQPRGHFYEHHYTAAIINVCSVCKLASICLLFALCYVPSLLPSRIAISGYCGRIIMSAVWRNATARAAAATAAAGGKGSGHHSDSPFGFIRALSGATQTEKEGRPLRARPGVNKGRTADSTQLSIFDYSII